MLSLSEIADEKKKNGYPDSTDNCILVQKTSAQFSFYFDSLTHLPFVISAETNGLLFIGLTQHGKINGKNKFIPADQLGLIEFTPVLFMYFQNAFVFNAMKLNIDEPVVGHTTYIAYTSMLGQRFWKNHIENVQKIISQYPTPNS